MFFLSRSQTNGLSALAEGILMVILLVITIIFHIFLNFKYGRQSFYLPESMGDEMRANETRYAQEMAAERQAAGGHRSSDKGAPLQNSQSQVTRRDSGAINREKAPFSKEGKDTDSWKRAGAPASAQYSRYQSGSDQPTGTPPPVNDDEATTVGRGSQEDLEQGSGGARGDRELDRGDGDEIEGGLDENTFKHPALWRGQPTVWIIHDDLGISSEAVRNARARGVDMTDEDTSINEKGKVKIHTKTLPGLDWTK